MSVEELNDNKRYHLTIIEGIDETPFTIIKRENKDTYDIAIGNNIIDETNFKEDKEVKDYINSKPWKLIINATIVMQDYYKEIDKQLKNLEK